jgi:hypothetical protein
VRALRWLLIALVAMVLQACSTEPAGPPRLGTVLLSDAADAAPKSTFGTETAQIVVVAELLDLPADATVSSSWIAEETAVVPPDYVIDESAVTVGAGMNSATFSLSRPDAGWPTGRYRVDLLIDGVAAKSLPFSIE